MIRSATEYVTARLELKLLGEHLQRLQESHPVGSKGVTNAGIRKMIARLHEELGMFEGSE